MACNDRQLTQAQREAAFDQMRTAGVVRAARPFSGEPTPENLVDYLNREVYPALRASREKLNDVYRQVTDNAPSANPLGYYFSTEITNADPTVGRLRLDNATQNAATTIRISQQNGRLDDVAVWLDVMQGSITVPIGVITLYDAIDPKRFLRFELDTMVDQGAYWDLGVTFAESSHPNPFVDGESVVLSFIPGVAPSGTTVPVGSLSDIPDNTFVGNISGATAAPSAEPLADLSSATILYDSSSHTFIREAISGFTTVGTNSGVSTSAEPIVSYSASANMVNERVLSDGTNTTVSTAVAGQISIGVDDLPITAIADIAQSRFLGRAEGAGTGAVTALTPTQAVSIIDGENVTWTGTHTFSNDVVLGEIIRNTAIFSITTLAADQTDLAIGAVSMVRLVTTGGAPPYRLNSMIATVNDQWVWIENADNNATDTLIITHEHAGSTAINRFVISNQVDLYLPPRTGVWARYDAVTNRWFVAAVGIVNSNIQVGEIGRNKLASVAEQEVTTSGLISDLARTSDDVGIFMFSSTSATQIEGIVSTGGFPRGYPFVIHKQGAGNLDVVDAQGTGGAVSTATNAFATYRNKNIRLRDDEGALFADVDLNTGGTDAKRHLCVSHRWPFHNSDENAIGDMIRHNNTDWDSFPSSLLTAASTLVVTNSTTKTNALALTCPADTLVVGAMYELILNADVNRGGTATASNFTFGVQLNGTTMPSSSVTAAVNTAAGTYVLTLRGLFRIDSTGPNAVCFFDFTHSLTGAATSGNVGGSTTITLSASNTIGIFGQFSAAVLALQFRAYHGWIRRIF